MSLNVVCLMGRLVYEPELKQTQSGVSFINFRIAVDRKFTKGEDKQTDYIDIVAWRHTAEFVAKYMKKGSLVAVNGSLQTRQYQDKDGNKRTVTEVLADNVYFSESKRRDDGNALDNVAQTAKQAGVDVGYTDAHQQDFEEITDDDDLPF